MPCSQYVKWRLDQQIWDTDPQTGHQTLAKQFRHRLLFGNENLKKFGDVL